MSNSGLFDVCMLTPPGRGAVATIAAAGAGAAAAIDHFFCTSAAAAPSGLVVGRICYGRWASASGEEIVVCRKAADQFEIHCHGGASAPRTLLDDLSSRGGRLVDWRAWLAIQAHDTIEHDALVALTFARSERTANILLEQWHGALAQELRAALAGCTRQDVAAASKRLRALAHRGSLGWHLTQPYQVVLTGRPNVGKSSLINALVGYERAIVLDAPGTTRDVVTAETAIDGWPVALSDTAGLRPSSDPLEDAGVQRARDRLAASDLVILVLDASLPPSIEDGLLRAEFPTALVVENKCDLRPSDSGSRTSPDSTTLETSALTGEGVGDLLRAIGRRLVAEPPAAGAAVPFTSLQVRAINEAIILLQGHDVELAAALLAPLVSDGRQA